MLKIAEDPHRLADPEEHGVGIYNTWQDAERVQGILRETTSADYMTAGAAFADSDRL